MIQTKPALEVPFVDLSLTNGPVMEELRDAFEKVLHYHSFVGGPEVLSFEQSLASYVGAKYARTVSSGTSALQLALEAAGIGPGQEVIIPPNTFFATAEAVVAAGATVVFADVDIATGLIDPAAVNAALTPRTSAIIPVHLFGQVADMDRLCEIAGRKGLFLLEDACQAIGSTWMGQPAGSLGDAAAFSFYPSKNLGALGDAGAVTTSDSRIATQIELLRDHGQEGKYVHARSAYNHRLGGLQAAFLAAKLPRLAGLQKLRDNAVASYRKLLPGVPGVKLLRVDSRGRHTHHLLVVRVANRDAVLEAMRAQGIQAMVHYPTPIHRTPAWKVFGGDEMSFPNSETLCSSILSLPLFPGMTDAQVERSVEVLGEAVAANPGLLEEA